MTLLTSWYLSLISLDVGTLMIRELQVGATLLNKTIKIILVTWHEGELIRMGPCVLPVILD